MNTLTNEHSLGWQMAKAQKELKEAYDNFDNAESQYVDVAIHKINAANTLVDALRKEMDKEKELHPTAPIRKKGFKQYLVSKLYHVKGIITNG